GGPVPRSRGPRRRALHRAPRAARRERRPRLGVEDVRARRPCAAARSGGADEHAARRRDARRGAHGRGRGPPVGPPRRRRARPPALGPRRAPVRGHRARARDPPRRAGALLRGGGRCQEPRLRASAAPGAAVRRLLLVPLAAIGVGAAAYVPWEDLTETDRLFAVET